VSKNLSNYIFRIYGAFGLLFFVLAGGAVLLVVGLPLSLIKRGERERFGILASVLLANMCVRFMPMFCRLDVTGRDTLPYGEGYLVVSNHRSAVDIPLTIMTTHTQGVSKRVVLFIPFLGVLGYMGGAIFFKRKVAGERKRALRESLEMMLSGNALQVYPEGTRTRDGKLRKPKLGLVQACWDKGITVVPSALWGTENVVPPPVQLRIGVRVKQRILAPMRPSDWPDRESFATEVWRRVVDATEALERSSSS
jgi:1-acyl-sn-glycerol-3-phosphate acyltransferase